MELHFNNICKVLNFELRRLGQIRKYLDNNATKTLASAFILSRLDYCNSVFVGLPQKKLKRLQSIQNNAARLVLREPRRAHVTPMLRSLHWLPVKARIEYKIALLCFKSLNCEFPSYIKELISPYNPSRTLRSSDANLLTVPVKKLKTFGERSFSFAGPTVWNSLPSHIRSLQTIGRFRSALKTHLFQKYLS